MGLSEDEKHYNDQFTLDPVEWDIFKGARSKSFEMSVLKDRGCHLFLETDNLFHSFGNVWKLGEGVFVLKGALPRLARCFSLIRSADVFGKLQAAAQVKPLLRSERPAAMSRSVSEKEYSKQERVHWNTILQKVVENQHSDWLLSPPGLKRAQVSMEHKSVSIFVITRLPLTHTSYTS
ncbi:hypothetical protein DENSPDRAFT_843372 [Dentipellis sp. KUC8613]|nr:hypothetical protein DENSPDRAFT_843372 [Dentipellis sp. KUC8613]